MIITSIMSSLTFFLFMYIQMYDLYHFPSKISFSTFMIVVFYEALCVFPPTFPLSSRDSFSIISHLKRSFG